MKKLARYALNILIALDQFANTVLGGDPDETISSRMAKHVAKNQCVICKGICWLLGRIQVDHCKQSLEPDEGQYEIIK